MKLFSVLAAVAACTAGADVRNCGTVAINGQSTLEPVPVGDNKDSASGQCICPSGQFGYRVESGTACTVWAYDGANGPNKCDPASTNFKAAENTTATLTGIALSTIDMSGADSLVQFTIDMPMTQGRTFTDLTVVGPGDDLVDDNCVPGKGVFTSFVKASATAACVEKWDIVAPFEKLRTCGFRYTNPQPYAGFQTYDGIVRVGYKEPVEVGVPGSGFATTMVRSTSVDYPFRIKFRSEFVAYMNVSNARVFSPYKADFAITGQNIPKDANENPTATIGYTIQYPYAITDWAQPKLTLQGANDKGIADVIMATTLKRSDSWDSTKLGSTDAAICKTPDDYRVGGTTVVDANKLAATCKKSDNLMVFRPAAGECQFVNAKYTLPFTVWCGEGIATPDCPLEAAAPGGWSGTTLTGNYAEFTISSEPFCTGSVAADTINNVITISDFKAYDSTFNSYKDAWRWGDDLYMQMSFAGLAVTDVKMPRLESSYSQTGVNTTSATSIQQTSTWSLVSEVVTGSGSDKALVTGSNIPLTGFSAASGSNLGLQVETQRYRFVVKINDLLLVPGTKDGDGNDVSSSSQMSVPVRGFDKFLLLRATIEVQYGTDNRRRRRQVNAGTGTKVSEQQTIQAPETEAAAAAPNSAVRAAPAVALVLALLSAVALL